MIQFTGWSQCFHLFSFVSTTIILGTFRLPQLFSHYYIYFVQRAFCFIFPFSVLFFFLSFVSFYFVFLFNFYTRCLLFDSLLLYYYYYFDISIAIYRPTHAISISKLFTHPHGACGYSSAKMYIIITPNVILNTDKNGKVLNV